MIEHKETYEEEKQKAIKRKHYTALSTRHYVAWLKEQIKIKDKAITVLLKELSKRSGIEQPRLRKALNKHLSKTQNLDNVS